MKLDFHYVIRLAKSSLTRNRNTPTELHLHGDKTQITVLACASAAGYAIPPMVIYDRKGLNPDWLIGEVPGTSYGL